jgi:uncharacterized membrane protein
VGGSDLVLVVSVFLASAVEMVEALTIVVAVGVTRGWRQALVGAGLAVVVLAVLVGAFGPALVRVPLDALRIVVGGLLLILGLQWYRKAALRAAGLKAKHDEDAIFAAQVAALSVGAGIGGPGGAATGVVTAEPAAADPTGSTPAPETAAGTARATASTDPAATGPARDVTGSTVAFKGVFLEGLEVVVIVLTVGSASHRVGLAAAAAGVALAVVAGVGIVMARQLAGVPENLMKFAVGVMLVSFGTFWSGEGVGLHWPGSDLSLLVLIAVYAVSARLLVLWLRRRPSRARAVVTVPDPDPDDAGGDGVAPAANSEPRRPGLVRGVAALGHFAWEFVVGDTPELAVAAVVVVAVAALLVHAGTPAALAGAVLVAMVLTSLALSAGRARGAPVD